MLRTDFFPNIVTIRYPNIVTIDKCVAVYGQPLYRVTRKNFGGRYAEAFVTQLSSQETVFFAVQEFNKVYNNSIKISQDNCGVMSGHYLDVEDFDKCLPSDAKPYETKREMFMAMVTDPNLMIIWRKAKVSQLKDEKDRFDVVCKFQDCHMTINKVITTTDTVFPCKNPYVCYEFENKGDEDGTVIVGLISPPGIRRTIMTGDILVTKTGRLLGFDDYPYYLWQRIRPKVEEGQPAPPKVEEEKPEPRLSFSKRLKKWWCKGIWV